MPFKCAIVCHIQWKRKLQKNKLHIISEKPGIIPGCPKCVKYQTMTSPVACRANIKVSSTETGAIFGNIVYESTAYADRSVVVLNDIHIDIMDYISPASCPDVQFRSMWAEFEWENKVSSWTAADAQQHMFSG